MEIMGGNTFLMNFYPDLKRMKKEVEKMETKTKVRIMGIILVVLAVAAVLIETAAAKKCQWC